METLRNHDHLTARVIRPGEAERDDSGWETATTEERINAVWFCASSGRGIKPVNRDFRDLLAEFNAQSVEYIIVGLDCESRCQAIRKP